MTRQPDPGAVLARAATAADGAAPHPVAVDGPAPGAGPRRGLLAVLGTAEFMLVLDLSVVNVALPRIQAGLGFAPGALAWVINAYTLAFGGFLLLGGRAADLFGGRRVFLAALSVFTVASLACGLAAGPGALIVARAVQGLSAGVLSPATLGILTGVFTGSRARNRALSIWTAVAIGGGAAGGIAGGVLAGLLSWRWIFFVNVPVGAGLLTAAWLCLPRTQAGAPGRRLDLAGAVTVTGSLAAITWALIRAQASGWASAQVAGTLTAGAVLLGVFTLVETRMARAPLVPFAVFRSRLVSAGNALSFLSFLPVMAIWFFLTLYLQDVRGYTALQAGLVFLPLSLAVAAGTQASFKVITRADNRLLFLAGGLTAAGGAACLIQLAPPRGLWAVIVPACLVMVGGGLMFAPIMAAATAGLPPSQGGLASGLLNTSRQAGGALGLAILASAGAVHTGAHHGAGHAALAARFGAAFGAAAGIFAATAVIGSLILPRQVSIPESGGRAQEPGEGDQPAPGGRGGSEPARNHTGVR